MSIELLAIIVTVILAFTGYIINHYNNVRLLKQKERLDLIEKRINEFYGPMYISSMAGKTAYKTLLQKLGKRKVFDENNPPDEEQLKEWRIWSETVFMPINEFREELIYKNAYLIMDEEIPQTFVGFVTHVTAYKVILKKWEMGDFSEHTPALDFPEGFFEHIEEAYLRLKKEQLRLIGESNNSWRANL